MDSPSSLNEKVSERAQKFRAVVEDATDDGVRRIWINFSDTHEQASQIWLKEDLKERQGIIREVAQKRGIRLE